MTRRENFLKTLKHEKNGRMPACVVIDNFNYPMSLPEGFDMEKITGFTDPEGMIELSEFYGLDTLIRMVPSNIRTGYSPGVSVKSDFMDNGRTITVWDTPVGSMESISELSKEANTTFLSKYPVVTEKDYTTLLTLIDYQRYSVDEDNILETNRILGLIGDEGIAYAVGPCTPIMELTRNWMGLERFVYELQDHPEMITRVLDVMTENYCRKFELLAQNTPCEVIVFWDDVNSLYITPEMFREYSVPVMERYSDIAHKHGKILVCHTCGKIRSFLKLFLETGVDAVDWVAPNPVGDVNPRDAQELWGDRITMILSTVPQIFRNGSPDQVEEHMHSLLSDLDIRKNLVFMLCPPIGTPLENLKRAIGVINRSYGVPKNRSIKFGNIFE